MFLISNSTYLMPVDRTVVDFVHIFLDFFLTIKCNANCSIFAGDLEEVSFPS
jgi:hypothetical protein